VRTISAVAVALAVIVACAPVAPPVGVTLHGKNGGDIVVTVLDEGRYVAAVQPAAPDRMPVTVDVGNPDGNQRVLRVAWIAGPCRQTATIELVRLANRVNLRFDERPVCAEQSGVFAAVELLLAQPIDADSVDVTDLRR
jgi:hypothetical protein